MPSRVDHGIIKIHDPDVLKSEWTVRIVQDNPLAPSPVDDPGVRHESGHMTWTRVPPWSGVT